MLQTLRIAQPCGRLLAAAIGLIALTAALACATTTAAAKRGDAGGGETVRTTINLPALVLDNLCNGDVVVLSGDLHITTTTTPHRDGGYTVRSSADARNLRGSRIAPPPPIGYHGWDREDTFSYYAPPPQPSQHRVVHWTRLVPEADEPVMYLVFEIRETVLADGTVVPVLERAYLKCSPPTHRRWGK
jgi:hypothetical protein